MIETYKNFKEIAQLNEEALNVEMVNNYKETQDMTVLAKVYVKHFAFFIRISEKFFNITEQDKASCIVEEIHKALMDYDASRGVQIQTLVTKYVNNRLMGATQRENYQRRKINTLSDSYEKLAKIDAMPEVAVEDSSTLETLSVLDTLNLSDNERRYCEIILLDKTATLANKEKDKEVVSTTKILDTEVAQVMGITGAGVAYIRKNLAKKLTPSMILGI